jgi:hypothetical protein
VSNPFTSGDKTKVACVAIGAVAIIESAALAMGVNGVVLATSIGVVAAIAGGVLGFKIGRGE